MVADITITEKSFGPKNLYKNIRFSIDNGEKIGIVGRNGVGKSTLFHILAGTDTDFEGDIIYRRGVSVVATAQEHGEIPDDTTVLQYVLQGLPEYGGLSHIIETYPDTMGDDMQMITAYTEALQRFEDKGFYRIEEQIERELDTFQLSGVAHRPFRTLSGGQKRLVEVIKVMHSDAHLALVDEPTNHMDYVAKQQFVDWMKAAREAMLVVTHDRDVLAHVDRIIEIKDGTSQSFKGNYDAYLRQNAVSTGSQMNEFQLIERRITNLKQKVIDYQRLKEKARNPATIQKFKRLETTSRAELAELQAKEKPTFWIDKESVEGLNYKVANQYEKFKARNIRMNMKSDENRSKHVLVKASTLSLGYDTPLFDGISIDLREGESVELRGRNGAGKTTIIKALLGSREPKYFAGELELDSKTRVGIYEQESSKEYFSLSLEDAIERVYLDRDLSITTTKVRSLLNDYLFSDGDAKVPVAQLSGGQKARVSLARVLYSKPDVLILDDPISAVLPKQ